MLPVLFHCKGDRIADALSWLWCVAIVTIIQTILYDSAALPQSHTGGEETNYRPLSLARSAYFPREKLVQLQL